MELSNETIIYLIIPHEYDDETDSFIEQSKGNYWGNKNSKAIRIWVDEDTLNTYVTTTINTIIENNWIEDLQYKSDKTNYHR